MLIELSNATIYYEVYGDGEPLLLLHGNGESSEIFNKLIPILSKKYKMYLIDTRGHGKSSMVNDLHYDDMAVDIYEFINKLNIEKPIIYGFSDGGIIALLLSIRYPNLLSRIVVSGVNVNPKGIKLRWRFLFKIVYFFTKSYLYKLMLKEPNITNEMLNSINIPVVITAGSKDVISYKHLKNISNNISNCELIILNKENHSSYIVNSSKIAEYI